MANSREDIEKIHSMNDLEGSVIKKERWNKVEQEGEVKHQQFDDIKRGLMKDQIEAVKNQAR